MLQENMDAVRAHIESTSSEKERMEQQKAEAQAKAIEDQAMEKDKAISMEGYGEYVCRGMALK